MTVEERSNMYLLPLYFIITMTDKGIDKSFTVKGDIEASYGNIIILL